MSPAPDTLDSEFAAYRAGDRGALDRLFRQMEAGLLRRARRLTADMPADITGEVVAETFVLLLEKPYQFDPARGSVQSFIFANVLPEAVRRVRANYTMPGFPKRRRGATKTTVAVTASLDDMPEMVSAGYGTPEAMEAACDAHLIWSRSTPPMRLIIGGLMDGKKQVEIAAETGMNRFQVARMITGLQRQFAAVA